MEKTRVKKKKAATNWRKRALEAEEENRWQADSLAVFRSKFGAQSNCQALDAIDGLRHQVEVGDALLDKQRERLIRLTEMKNKAQSFINVFRTVGMDLYVTCELDGTQWTKVYNITNAVLALAPLERSIAALEVDTAIPQKEKP